MRNRVAFLVFGILVPCGLLGANAFAQSASPPSNEGSRLTPLNWPPPAPAQVTTLADLIRDVSARNPELAALERRIAAARARVPQAGALPDPMFEYGVMNEGGPFPFQTLGKNGFSEVYVGVTQEIPYPGKRALRERVAQEDVEVERFRRDGRGRELVASVKEMYLELYGLQAMASIVERNGRTLEQLERAAAVRLAVGTTPQQDVLDAEVELSRIEERLTMFRRRALTAEARVRSVLRQPADWTLGTLAPVDAPTELPPLEELRRLALAQFPEILATEREASRAEFAVQLARRELKPDFGASFVYHNRGGLDPYWSFGGTLRVPLYRGRKQQKAIEEATASLEGARSTIEARRLDVAYQVEDAYATATTARRLLRLYDEALLKQARLALESALSSYQVGRIDFLTTLTSWTRLRDHEVLHFEHLVDLLRALARLEALTGLELLK